MFSLDVERKKDCFASIAPYSYNNGHCWPCMNCSTDACILVEYMSSLFAELQEKIPQ